MAPLKLLFNGKDTYFVLLCLLNPVWGRCHVCLLSGRYFIHDFMLLGPHKSPAELSIVILHHRFYVFFCDQENHNMTSYLYYW